MRVIIQLLALQQWWSISTGSCLTTHLTDLISLWATTTCLPTWSTDCDHSASTKMSWWKVSKRGWAAGFFDTGIEKLIPRYDKCLHSGGDYVKNELKYVHIFCFLIAYFVNSSPNVTFRIALVFVHICQNSACFTWNFNRVPLLSPKWLTVKKMVRDTKHGKGKRQSIPCA
jgi:hypothetical protein